MRIHWVANIVFLLASAHAASAQPAEGLPPPPDGNLRVDLRCADFWATPDSGLQVTVDGVAPPVAGINGRDVLVEGKHGPYETWVATDVGFDIAPGPHHVALAAPGCASIDRDVMTPLAGPTIVQGRLAITDASLMGTTAAPNGLGFTVGALATMMPTHGGVTNLGSISTAYSTDAHETNGLWMSTSYEHRRLLLAWDIAASWGSASGTLTPISEQIPGSVAGPMPYSDTEIDLRTAMRVGVRVPMQSVALAAGSGLGVSIITHVGGGNDDLPVAIAPDGMEPSLFVPVWASLTYKPSCNIGVQALASYDLHPTDSTLDGLALVAGVQWQPNNACSDPAGVRIR